jgi:hypothetical protein
MTLTDLASMVAILYFDLADAEDDLLVLSEEGNTDQATTKRLALLLRRIEKPVAALLSALPTRERQHTCQSEASLFLPVALKD